jgi:hypothetical protein
VHEHHAQDRAVEPDLIEDLGDVHVDRKIRHRLRQQEREQDRAPPRQLEARQRIACRDRHGKAHDHRQNSDPHTGAE